MVIQLDQHIKRVFYFKFIPKYYFNLKGNKTTLPLKIRNIGVHFELFINNSTDIHKK